MRREIKFYARTPEEKNRFLAEDRAVNNARRDYLKVVEWYAKAKPGEPVPPPEKRGYTVPALLVAERAKRKAQRLAVFAVAREAREVAAASAKAVRVRAKQIESAKALVERLSADLEAALGVLCDLEGSAKS
jgi:hypothetical protein